MSSLWGYNNKNIMDWSIHNNSNSVITLVHQSLHADGQGRKWFTQSQYQEQWRFHFENKAAIPTHSSCHDRKAIKTNERKARDHVKLINLFFTPASMARNNLLRCYRKSFNRTAFIQIRPINHIFNSQSFYLYIKSWSSRCHILIPNSILIKMQVRK